MKILVVGASGATGMKLVEALLQHGHELRVIVRSPENLPDNIKNHEYISVIRASLLELSDAEMEEHVAACDAVASCLGHNPTFKGIFGKPRRLVTDATRLLCNAIKANNPIAPVKFVLMNTVANRNRDLNESFSFIERIVIGLLRILVPPQPDNEAAAEYLRTAIGQHNPTIEWCAVRPSGLIDAEKTSEIEVYPSPTRSIIKDGQISRINVGYFMADLITNADVWSKWKGKMPVIYNKGTAFKK